MTPTRIALVFAALATVSGSACQAQTAIEKMLAPFKQTQDVSSKSAEELEKIKAGLTGLTDQSKAAIRELARSIVFQVTLPEFHETVKPRDDALQPRKNDKTVDEIINQINKQIINPPMGTTLNENQKDFHREFGSALCEAILFVMTDRDPPPLLRLNAARLLVPAAETAAPAVAIQITKLLKGGVFKDSKKAPVASPPDVIYYSLRAAETFLRKYDVTRPGTKDLNPDLLTELVVVLIQFVEKNPPILNVIAKSASPDPKVQETAQSAAIRFYRLQAIRALAQARNESYADKAGAHFPVFALAKVAIRDASIQPVASTKEMGEATLGLMRCNLGQDVNAELLAATVAYGTMECFRPRAERSEEMKLVDWKQLAQQFSNSTKAWASNSQRNPQVLAGGKKTISDAADKLEKEIFEPLMKPETALGSNINLDQVGNWLDGVRGGLPTVLIIDTKDRNKYLFTLPKR